jgi:hypothetical protein
LVAANLLGPANEPPVVLAEQDEHGASWADALAAMDAAAAPQTVEEALAKQQVLWVAAQMAAHAIPPQLPPIVMADVLLPQAIEPPVGPAVDRAPSKGELVAFYANHHRQLESGVKDVYTHVTTGGWPSIGWPSLFTTRRIHPSMNIFRWNANNKYSHLRFQLYGLVLREMDRAICQGQPITDDAACVIVEAKRAKTSGPLLGKWLKDEWDLLSIEDKKKYTWRSYKKRKSME